jgi:methyl-accepting chemotaxis protein
MSAERKPRFENAGNASSDQSDLSGIVAAINRSQAMIEFQVDGTILNANENFLGAVGYSLSEIQGQHHRMFCEPSYTASPAYAEFWKKLGRGEFESQEYMRITKSGKQIWIQASYNPVFDAQGKVIKVVKFATDITAQKIQNADFQGQLVAISKSQAVIEFNLDGTILRANDNFLGAVGYSADEVKGKHHRMFCDEKYTQTNEYRDFWARLGRGEFDSGEYRRFGKGGKEIWIQASYNPILDQNGKAFKVVKYATDISAQKLKDAQLNALSKAQAVIEFTPDGTILNANDNFLGALGYGIDEIKGRHHSMFCQPSYTQTVDYKKFWQDLSTGQFQSNQYLRLAKGGREIWIQATYNPVFDLTGKVFKVVKYASDITKQKNDQLALISALKDTFSQLASAATQLESTAANLKTNAEKSNQIITSTSGASEEVSQGVRTVATNTEEMSASIKEIARNANEASKTSVTSLAQARTTNDTISKLGQSSQEIGNVIKVISSIAQQTNLLALNATIEAARAGDAGRGFAVVANEVKELAKQTATATEDITARITSIQASSSSAVSDVASIGQTIEKLNGFAGAIAASVEEQAATTDEVARVVQESSLGVASITDNMRAVMTSASETLIGASQIRDASTGLNKIAAQLKDLISKIDA